MWFLVVGGQRLPISSLQRMAARLASSYMYAGAAVASACGPPHGSLLALPSVTKSTLPRRSEHLFHRAVRLRRIRTRRTRRDGACQLPVTDSAPSTGLAFQVSPSYLCLARLRMYNTCS